MTDQSTPDPEGLSARDAEVRRLLADARHDEPAPAEVTDRLDRVLADLAAEPAREATVTQLATRRRRAAGLLVAAAAAIVVGIGVAQVVQPAADESATTADAGDTALAESSEEPGAAAESAPQEDSEGGAAEAPESDSGLSAESLAEPLVRISPDAFADGARRARAIARRQPASELERGSGPYAAVEGCETSDWGRGTRLTVEYGPAPAVLVLREPTGDSQVADLFLCGEEKPLRSVTLPTR